MEDLDPSLPPAVLLARALGEVERLTRELRLISSQGTGTYELRMGLVDRHGRPWRHWEENARRAIEGEQDG